MGHLNWLVVNAKYEPGVLVLNNRNMLPTLGA